MLCWTDKEAVSGANPALVNNLNLQVIQPSEVAVNPWILSPTNPSAVATRGNET
jgi:hypothetical protein